MQVATNSEIKEHLIVIATATQNYLSICLNYCNSKRRVKFPTRQFHLKHELIDNSAQQLVVVERISRGKTSKQCDVSHVQRLTWKLQALVRQQFIQRN